jgi:hypothetical protein
LENLTKKYRLFKACRDFSFIQVSNYRSGSGSQPEKASGDGREKSGSVQICTQMKQPVFFNEFISIVY